MDKDKQRIAIAEACGWKPAEPPNSRVWWKDGEWVGNVYNPPDYLNDLNTIQRAVVDVLTEPQFIRFTQALAGIVRKAHEERAWTWSNEMLVASATASEWCEALLAVIGKWEEDK